MTKKGLSDAALTERILEFHDKLTSVDHVRERVLTLEPEVDQRNLKWIILFKILLEEETYSLEEARLEERVIAYENSIIERSTSLDFLDPSAHEDIRVQAYTTYRVVLEAAWRNDNDISVDEGELLRVLRNRLNISMEEHWLISCQLGRFPKLGAKPHSIYEINEARRSLQKHGLLWSYRDDSKRDMDVIPLEVAEVLRTHVADPPAELQKTNFLRVLQHDSIKLTDLQKVLIDHKMDRYGKKDELIGRIASSDLQPSAVLALLDRGKLSDMCRAMGLQTSGNKPDLIDRLIDFYDDLSFAARTSHDPREAMYENYVLLANRDYPSLKAKKLISKDLEIEHMFEKATMYLFEKKLCANIESPRTKKRADGRILLDDHKSMLWDCKSVERQFNLQDCLDSQFDLYIRRERESGFEILAFIVIAPSFTPHSLKLAKMYKAKTNCDILLLEADALKYIADSWSEGDHGKPFPVILFNDTTIIDQASAEVILSLA